jgi:hypothetical protein
MNQNVKHFIYGAILLGGGLYLGHLFGRIETYRETGGIIASSHFNEASANLNMHITLLQLLHNKDIKSASDKLEALVDGDLTALSQYPVHKTPCKDDVQKAIEKAKEYREKYPVSNRSKEVTGAVGKAFDLATHTRNLGNPYTGGAMTWDVKKGEHLVQRLIWREKSGDLPVECCR